MEYHLVFSTRSKGDFIHFYHCCFNLITEACWNLFTHPFYSHIHTYPGFWQIVACGRFAWEATVWTAVLMFYRGYFAFVINVTLWARMAVTSLFSFFLSFFLFFYFDFSQASGEGSLRYGVVGRMLIKFLHWNNWIEVLLRNTEECVIAWNLGFQDRVFSAQYSHLYCMYVLIMLLVLLPIQGPWRH